jgi:hypothetical protein
VPPRAPTHCKRAVVVQRHHDNTRQHKIWSLRHRDGRWQRAPRGVWRTAALDVQCIQRGDCDKGRRIAEFPAVSQRCRASRPLTTTSTVTRSRVGQPDGRRAHGRQALCLLHPRWVVRIPTTICKQRRDCEQCIVFGELTRFSNASGAHTANDSNVCSLTRALRSSSVYRTFTLARKVHTHIRVYKYTRPQVQPRVVSARPHQRQTSFPRKAACSSRSSDGWVGQ